MNSKHLPAIFSQPERLDPFAVGFDHLFDQFSLITSQQTGFPKYNIDHYPNNVTKISVALAGYDEKEIRIELEDNQLTISANVEVDTNSAQEGSYRGIAHRSFAQRFILGEHIEVKDASFKNGLLVVTLEKIVPEHKKLKVIPINKA